VNSGITTRIYDRIDNVDPEEWNSLVAGDDVLATHRFVKLCEDAALAGVHFRHVIVHERGRLAAIATLCTLDVRLDLMAGHSTRAVAAAVRRVFPPFLKARVLLGGLPVSLGSSNLRLAPGASPHVLAALAKIAKEVATELDASVIAWKEFSPAETIALDPLQAAGYLMLPSIPACTLAVRWTTLADYLTSMRAGYRRQALTALRADGLAVRRIDDWREYCPRIFALYEQVMDRADMQLERLNLRFFQLLQPVLGCHALVVERDGRLLAAAIVHHAGATGLFLLAGIDYDDHREHGVYPRLVTEVIADAIAAGVRMLELGQTSYDLKRRLGALTVPRSLYLRHVSPALHHLVRVAAPTLFPDRYFAPRRVFAR